MKTSRILILFVFTILLAGNVRANVGNNVTVHYYFYNLDGTKIIGSNSLNATNIGCTNTTGPGGTVALFCDGASGELYKELKGH